MDAPKSLFASEQLSLGAKALGALMWSYARPGALFIWPAPKKLAAELGIDESRMNKLVKELYAAGFATRMKDANPPGWQLHSPVSATGTGERSPVSTHRGVEQAPVSAPTLTGEWKEHSPVSAEDSIESRSEDTDSTYETLTGEHSPVSAQHAPVSGHAPVSVTGTGERSPVSVVRPRTNGSTFTGPRHVSDIDRFERQTQVHQFPKTPEELLGRHGAKIFAELPMFDGKNGRPSRLSALRGKWNAFERELHKSWSEPGAVDAVTSWLTMDGQRFRFAWERDGGAVALPKAPATTTTVYDDDEPLNAIDPSDPAYGAGK
jgi:hypothetical protein